LNEKYTFDHFVIGASNRFAARRRGRCGRGARSRLQPALIWESPVGQDHLLHAVGHYAQRLFPGMRVRYVSTEEFTNDFINSRCATTEGGRSSAATGTSTSCLVDEHPVLEGKEGNQEEFFQP